MAHGRRRVSGERPRPVVDTAYLSIQGDSHAVTIPTLALDLGGTRMRGALVWPDGTVTDRVVEPTPRDQPCANALHQLMRAVAADAGGEGFDSVVVGVPGRVDYGAGRLEYAPNLPPGWRDELDVESLSSAIGRPVSLANDGDMAAVGEALFGAGQSYRDVVYVTFSTGVGAGVVLDGQLVRARRSLGEIGHTVLLRADADGAAATVEALASGTALDRESTRAGLLVAGAEMVARVRAGDAGATAVLDGVAEAIAATVVNLAHLFSPDVVVVGGGLGRNLDLFGWQVSAALERYGPRDLAAPILVTQASLGDDSGLVGAAGWGAATGLSR